jgi:ATP-dependent helicase/nuclease subunit A
MADDGAAALGRAIHRLLEWAGRVDAEASIGELAAAAAAEFGVAADAVERHGGAILRHPEGARFFTGSQILWSGNEVSVSDASEVLRIDRLVQIEEASGPAWWVLDYKLHHAPEALAPYRAQLLRYRDVVAQAQPGTSVRCAFVTGEGRVVELV